jgi:hypothetical protein
MDSVSIVTVFKLSVNSLSKYYTWETRLKFAFIKIVSFNYSSCGLVGVPL